MFFWNLLFKMGFRYDVFLVFSTDMWEVRKKWDNIEVLGSFKGVRFWEEFLSVVKTGLVARGGRHLFIQVGYISLVKQSGFHDGGVMHRMMADFERLRAELSADT